MQLCNSSSYIVILVVILHKYQTPLSLVSVPLVAVYTYHQTLKMFWPPSSLPPPPKKRTHTNTHPSTPHPSLPPQKNLKAKTNQPTQNCLKNIDVNHSTSTVDCNSNTNSTRVTSSSSSTKYHMYCKLIVILVLYYYSISNSFILISIMWHDNWSPVPAQFHLHLLCFIFMGYWYCVW